MKQSTNIQSVRSRAVVIFMSLLLAVGASTSKAWADESTRTAVKTNVTKASDYMKKQLDSFVAALQESEAPAQNTTRVNIHISNTENTVEITPVVQQQNTRVIRIVVTPAPIIYDTPKPGEPGSKEWQDEWQKNWDAMGQKNAEMQAQVEASQKQFCIDHPSLCK